MAERAADAGCGAELDLLGDQRGTLNLGNPDRRSSSARLNPYLLKGSGAFGSYFFSFETLCDPSQDEAGVMYGLVAEAIQVVPDLSWVAFRINPRARFNNGDPVTAAALKYAFDAVTSDKADPGLAAELAMARSAVVADALTVRFELAVRSREAIYALGARLPVFSPKWGMGPDGKTKPFDKIIDDVPIATGAYVVARTHSVRRLDLVRDPNYWARNEGVRRGFYNFDKIVYRYYADGAVQFQAFKAGDIDHDADIAASLEPWLVNLAKLGIRPHCGRSTSRSSSNGSRPSTSTSRSSISANSCCRRRHC